MLEALAGRTGTITLSVVSSLSLTINLLLPGGGGKSRMLEALAGRTGTTTLSVFSTVSD